jgi:hypothetical protein
MFSETYLERCVEIVGIDRSLLQDSATGGSGRTIFAAARSSFSQRHA